MSPVVLLIAVLWFGVVSPCLLISVVRDYIDYRRLTTFMESRKQR